MKKLKSGVYPAMITPYKTDGTIDFQAVDRLVKWYIQEGCAGVFAACQSSEIYYLSLSERIALVEQVLKSADGKLDVVACGATDFDFDKMLDEANTIASLGVKAEVLLTNHLANENENDNVFIERLDRACDKLYKFDLGLYEMPVPYKRLLTKRILSHCKETGRFKFIKDTCCNAEEIAEKLKVIKNSDILLFNANSETLLKTVESGAAGISGIMCNYHPFLYVKMLEEYNNGNKEKAWELQYLISTLSYCCTGYPSSAKRYLMHEGILTDCFARMGEKLNYNSEIMIEHLYKFTKAQEAKYR